ncbi:ribonuclease P protein component [Pelomonas sp. KK5]|uniref:ribonuclease P protein component n=1 Tax=Pelomonas sp. KK5 TaxID=1855730 RepID=UPI00117DF327|nr:ribonuclease P protein component [Pelomonas sp. KK5]
MIGRIVRSADFERVLGKPSRARSAHFALHHLAESPSEAAWRAKHLSTGAGDLSTGDVQVIHKAVDDLPPAGRWLGTVVPKRHAKRAVTRNLMKRQIRQAFDQASRGDEPVLPPGLWVVRLRSPFDRQQFPSASSDALRAAVRAELAQLVARVLPRAARS